MSVYGRLPSEFDEETAMGLFANIEAIEASNALVMARAVAIAFGDAKSLASCVYATTRSEKLAQRVEIQAKRERWMNG